MKHLNISYVLIFLLCVTSAMAAVSVEVSTDNLTWVDVTVAQYGGQIDEIQNKANIQNLQENTIYYVRAKSDTTAWFYNSTTTVTSDWEESKMLAIVLVLFAGMLYFSWMGFSSGNAYAVKIFGYGMSLVFLLMAFFLIWANERGESLVSMLRINFYILFILSFAIAMVALSILMVKLITPEVEHDESGDDFKQDSKWMFGRNDKW